METRIIIEICEMWHDQERIIIAFIQKWLYIWLLLQILLMGLQNISDPTF